MKQLIIILVFFLVSCSPKLIYKSGKRIVTDTTSCSNIYVFGKNQVLPNDFELIEKIKTKGNFFTSSNYRTNESIDLIKKGANHLGGNAIKISKITFPGPFTSKSYDIEADVLLIKQKPDSIFELVNDTIFQKGIYVHLYRPNRIFGSGISYPIYLNNSFVGGLDNNDKIIMLLRDKFEKYYIEIEAYDKLYKIPVIIKENNIYIKCNVSGDGSPKIKMLTE